MPPIVDREPSHNAVDAVGLLPFARFVDRGRFIVSVLTLVLTSVAVSGCGRPRANPVELTEHETLVTSDNFDDVVVAADRPVLLDFSAAWCPPCQEMAPIVQRVAADYEGRLRVGVVDTDLRESAKLSQLFRVSGIPAFFIVIDGEAVSSKAGYVDESRFREWIDQEISAANSGNRDVVPAK